ncbi:MAG: poly(3-hydroxybutyrate) depolymerase [Pseudomonadota bacterium]|nr:poly(3-hydroxybutyrate) depolymerase [Pseudomonadota bacterium]
MRVRPTGFRIVAASPRRGVFRLALVFATALAQASLAGAAEPLPALGADLQATSVSGLSSGAYMAGQFQLAHAGIVVGAGIAAGGPWACADNPAARLSPFWPQVLAANATQALEGCMKDNLSGFGVGDPGALERRARDLAGEGAIGPIDALAGDKVYLFTGGKDSTVAPALVRRARDLYLRLGVPDANIALVEKPEAGHAFITEEGGGACGVSEPPFITDCDYDQAKAILGHIYGSLEGPAPPQPAVIFDQSPYAPGSGDGLASEGALVVPAACRQSPGCRIHVVFHGCRQGREFVGDAFITGSLYARWAAQNRIILLFPQVKSSIYNPRGCWDWWGYTGRDFLSREAPQIKAVRAMLDRLAAKP